MLSIDVTLIFHIFNFFLIYLIFRYFLGEKIAKAIQERRDNIEKEKLTAEKNRLESEILKQDIIKNLRESKSKAKEILLKAVKDSEDIKGEAVEEAKRLSGKILEDNKRDIESMKLEMQESLKRDTLNIAKNIAVKLLKRNVDEDAFFEDMKGNLK